MRILFVCLSVCLVSSVAAQSFPEVDTRNSTSSPFTANPVLNDPDHFQFLIVSDRTGGHRPEVFRSAVPKINALHPEFVMSVGDLIEGYTVDLDEINAQWDEFDSMVNQIDARFFYLAGNHDYSNQTMGDVWKERLGPDYYYFTYKDALFLCLNSEDGYYGSGKGHIGDDQFDYFKKVLSDHEDVRWTFVFMHQPLWTYDNTGRWEEMQGLLEGRKHTVFAGHVHQYTHYDRNDRDYVVLGTTGGVTPLRGPGYGEVDHLTWVTLTDEGPLMTNLLLDGIQDIRFANEESIDIVNSFSRQPPAAIQPVFYQGDSLELTNVTFSLKNEHSYPLHLKFQGLAHPQFLVSAPQFEETVLPGSEKEISLPVKVHNWNLSSELPLIFEMDGFFEQNGIRTVKWQERLTFFPQPMYEIQAESDSIVIDGRLEEWDSLSFHVQSPDESSEFGFAFDLRMVGEDVYVGVKVADPFLAGTGLQKGYTDSEGMMLCLDVNPTEVSAYNKGDFRAFTEGKWTILAITPEERIGSMLKIGNLPKGVEGRYYRNRFGYTAEFKIPGTFLKSIQGENWETFRLNIRVNDMLENEQVIPLSWKTDWWEDGTPGSGMFVKPGN